MLVSQLNEEDVKSVLEFIQHGCHLPEPGSDEILDHCRNGGGKLVPAERVAEWKSAFGTLAAHSVNLDDLTRLTTLAELGRNVLELSNRHNATVAATAPMPAPTGDPVSPTPMPASPPVKAAHLRTSLPPDDSVDDADTPAPSRTGSWRGKLGSALTGNHS